MKTNTPSRPLDALLKIQTAAAVTSPSALQPSSPSTFSFVLAFAAIYLIWGSTYLGIRIAIETMPPFLMAGIRFLIAGGVLLAFLRARGLPSPTLRQWRINTVIGIFLLLGGNGLVVWAEQFVPSGITALIIGVQLQGSAFFERLTAREQLSTVAALYERATDLARTLHALDTSVNAQELTQIDDRLAALTREPDDPERARRLSLLQRQRQAIVDIQGRRSQVASHLESCVLAMQNVRFDLLRLRSAGVAAVLGDLTQATQQAKALSRDVDNAIAAAGEIREAMRP